MNAANQNPLVPLGLSCLAGWSAMMVAFATWIFVVPHGRGFAPEVGPSGAFVIFGLVFSFCYLLDFLVIVVPCFLSFRLRTWPNVVLRGIGGAALFSLSVPSWVFAARTSSDGMLLSLTFAAVAGAASFAALKP